MMWTVLGISILSFCSACNSSKAPGSSYNLPVSDTTVLYQRDTVFSTGAVPSILPIRFTETVLATRKSAPTAKTWLLLYHPQIMSEPDGVYEIYITAIPPVRGGELSSTQTSFAGVLNLYDQTGPDAKDYVFVPINNPLQNIWQQSPSACYVTLLFRGNTLASGKAATHAGAIRFTSFRIVQTKE